MSERDMAKLLDLIERNLGKSWIEIGEWLRSQNDLDTIEARLVAGDVYGVIAEVQSAALKFAAETQTAYVTAGQRAAVWLDDKVTDKLIRFDQTNHRAVARAQANQLELVQGLTNESRLTVRNILVEGAQAGTNPRELARDIRDSIGLTPNQEQAVRSYRRALESGDFTNALGRELRDARSDRLLRRLATDGGALTPAQVDSIAERYRMNYIAHRAEVIARTESLRSVHEGTVELYRQAVERGDIEAESLLQEWNAGPATRYAREQHQRMDQQQRKFGEPFEAPDGTKLRYPGDPMAPVSHTAQCRCSVSTRLAA